MTATEGQHRPTKAHSSQRRPMQAHESPRQPTTANEGPRRPTAANDGQRRPTQAHEDKKGPNDARWRRLGPRYVFFFIFFILFLLLRDSGHPTRTRTPRNPYPGTRVRVFWGTGTGSPGKPQGYPCQSLVVVVAGDTAVASCDTSCLSSPLEVSGMSGVVCDVVMGSEARRMDRQVVGDGWDSFSTVAVSLILICAPFNHLLQNACSIPAQSFFYCCGNSSNHSSASL